MAFENGYASNQLRGDINVTPMIDVLLVLLIIFMVIAPVVPHGLEAALPQRSAHSSPLSPIVVQVIRARSGELSYKINQENVRIGELGSHLSSILSTRADKVLFVKADDALDFSAIATVMDIARNAGADHIGLMTSKDPL